MLPASEGWHPLHPLSPLLRSGQFALIGAVAASQSLDFVLGAPLVALVGFVVFVVAASAYGYVAWRFMGYRITAEHIEMRVGIIFRSHKRVPRARIESVDIARPLLARLCGLSEVRIEVASSNESQLRLRYMGEDNAEELRARLLRVVLDQTDEHGEETASPAQPAGEQQGRVIAEVNFSELALATIAPTVIGVALIVGFAAVFSAVASVVSSESILIGFGGAFALVLPIVGLLIRSVNQLLSLYGFTISEGPDGLLIRRGLVNLLTQKVPLARVQAVRIERPLLWRAFNRRRLIVDVAGYRGQGDAETTSVLMPITDERESEEILRHVFPGLSVQEMQFLNAPDKAKFRSPFAYEFYAVAMNKHFVASATGILNRRLDVIPHRKVQSLRISQGPWQRSLGLANLHIDSAGDNIAVTVYHREEAEAHRLAEWSRKAQEDASA